MTQSEWENASEEEREAEFERCKDRVYFYNTYWRKEGQPEIKQEDIEALEQMAMTMRLKPRYRTPDITEYLKKIRQFPLTEMDAFKTVKEQK